MNAGELLTINIPLGEYSQLLDDAKWLRCLRAAGVDNWEGYDYALELVDKEEVKDGINTTAK